MKICSDIHQTQHLFLLLLNRLICVTRLVTLLLGARGGRSSTDSKLAQSQSLRSLRRPSIALLLLLLLLPPATALVLGV